MVHSGEAMSTPTQRRSNPHALYQRSRSAWMCLSVTLCKPALTPSLWRRVELEARASVALPSLAPPQAIGLLH